MKGLQWLKQFWNEEEAMGTVEIVIIIAVLVGIALIFRDAIIRFAQSVMSTIFSSDEINGDVQPGNIRSENPA